MSMIIFIMYLSKANITLAILLSLTISFQTFDEFINLLKESQVLVMFKNYF